ISPGIVLIFTSYSRNLSYKKFTFSETKQATDCYYPPAQPETADALRGISVSVRRKDLYRIWMYWNLILIMFFARKL
ncbi:hypothetical protein, partial [Escherichia coli]